MMGARNGPTSTHGGDRPRNGDRDRDSARLTIVGYERAERYQESFLAAWESGLPELKAAIIREVLASFSGFRDRFTVFPDSGVTELHCYKCAAKWAIGYHPSLDVLVEQAHAHNMAAHSADG